METYKRNPQHPDDHPIIPSGEEYRIVYDRNELSEEQKQYEDKRAWRRQAMKERRLKREAEELEERRRLGTENEKEHLSYVDPYPGITPHDFDDTAERCTECNAFLWGTRNVYPLWQKSTERHSVLVPPYCLGCSRLFSARNMDMRKKIGIIRWLLVGKHEEIPESFDPSKSIGYLNISSLMRERASRMRNIPLYDHPDWDCLKSETELEFERRGGGGRSNEMLKNRVDIIRVPPKPVHEIEIASPRELRDLVVKSCGEDALLNHKCSPKRGSDLSVSFDHIEPVSKVRYRPGSYSIGNIQILSHRMNQVKGNFPNRELGRWLTQLLDTYNERYS